MATLDAVAFLRAKATNKTTVRTEDGISTTLNGMPKAYTASGLAALAGQNLKVTLPYKEVVKGTKAKTRSVIESQKDAETFVLGICGGAAEESAPPAGAA